MSLFLIVTRGHYAEQYANKIHIAHNIFIMYYALDRLFFALLMDEVLRMGFFGDFTFRSSSGRAWRRPSTEEI